MKTLHLTLKKKWFDMILSGEKTEEYREAKEYWLSRLGMLITEVNPRHTNVLITKKPDVISFTNGYGNDKPNMTIECLGVHYGYGKLEMGAPDDEKVIIIELGKIISTKNITK